MLEFETRGGYSNGESSLDTRIGNIFYGTDGYLELDGGTWKAFRQREKEPFAGSGLDEAKVSNDPLAPPGGTEHYANFIDAIRSDKNGGLNCDIEVGFLSSALPLMANISYRLGRHLKFNGAKEQFENDPEADAMLTREYRKPYIITNQV